MSRDKIKLCNNILLEVPIIPNKVQILRIKEKVKKKKKSIEKNKKLNIIVPNADFKIKNIYFTPKQRMNKKRFRHSFQIKKKKAKENKINNNFFNSKKKSKIGISVKKKLCQTNVKIPIIAFDLKNIKNIKKVSKKSFTDRILKKDKNLNVFDQANQHLNNLVNTIILRKSIDENSIRTKRSKEEISPIFKRLKKSYLDFVTNAENKFPLLFTSNKKGNNQNKNSTKRILNNEKIQKICCFSLPRSSFKNSKKGKTMPFVLDTRKSYIKNLCKVKLKLRKENRKNSEGRFSKMFTPELKRKFKSLFKKNDDNVTEKGNSIFFRHKSTFSKFKFSKIKTLNIEIDKAFQTTPTNKFFYVNSKKKPLLHLGTLTNRKNDLKVSKFSKTLFNIKTNRKSRRPFTFIKVWNMVNHQTG